jgi:hypothetical protein
MNPDGPITLDELNDELRRMRQEALALAEEQDSPFWRDRYLELSRAADSATIQLAYAESRIKQRRHEEEKSSQ